DGDRRDRTGIPILLEVESNCLETQRKRGLQAATPSCQQRSLSSTSATRAIARLECRQPKDYSRAKTAMLSLIPSPFLGHDQPRGEAPSTPTGFQFDPMERR